MSFVINPYRFAAAGGTAIATPTHFWNLNNVDRVDSADGLYDLGSKSPRNGGDSDWDLTNVSCTTSSSGGLNSQPVVSMTETAYLHRAGTDIAWDSTNDDSISVSTWVRATTLAGSVDTTRFIVAWRGGAYAVEPWIFDLEWKYVASNPNNIWFTNLDVDYDFRRAIDSATAPSTGTWYHIVGTYANGVSKLYVDGVLTATDSTGNGQPMSGFESTTAMPFPIGTPAADKGQTSGATGHAGEIGATGIWDTELTAGEVAALFGSGTTMLYYADYTFV